MVLDKAWLAQSTAQLRREDAKFGKKHISFDAILLRAFNALATYVLAESDESRKESDLKRAEMLFTAALKYNKSSPRARFGKAVLLATKGDWHRALDCFREVLMRAAPHKPESGVELQALKNLRFALATCFSGLGRVEKAKRALLAVCAAGDDVEALCALAYLEAREKPGGREAVQFMRKAMELDPENPVVLCQAANHAFLVGLDQSGAPRLENGEVPPSWKMARSFLEQALEKCENEELASEARYQLGRMAHAKGDFNLAINEYKQCLESFPNHLAGIYALAQVMVRQRLFSQAIKVLERAPSHLQEQKEVLKLLTSAYLATEHYMQARKSADALVKLSPVDVAAWSMKSEAYARSGDHKEALTGYERMAQLLEQDTSLQASVTPQMWNNLGTNLALYGDPGQARWAFECGTQQLEERLARVSNRQEEKDLHVVRLTLKFNRAWLSETHPAQPDIAEAMSEYLSLAEEHEWFADAFMRLGNQWQNLGMLPQALNTFKMAATHSPFQARLHCAESLRKAGKYREAIREAEHALKRAGEKEEHYARVFLGNLFFEASGQHKLASKDNYLKKAMECFVKAVEKKKDCYFAANGIGMVFARRGKLDLAKQTFQSVVQHQGMKDNASVYINLAHTFMGTHNNDTAAVRKAISLYQIAKDIEPEDVSVTLYIAKAYHVLEEYDDCGAILSEAAAFWPFNLVVKLNQALNWEVWARHDLSQDWQQSGISLQESLQRVKAARDHLAMAAHAWAFITSEWIGMSDKERHALGRASGNSKELLDVMRDSESRVSYCEELMGRAGNALTDLAHQLRVDDLQMEKIAKEKEEVKLDHERRTHQDSETEKERKLEAEDQAMRLMEVGRQIDLGRNLELFKEKTPAAKNSARKKKKGEEKQEGEEKEQEPKEDVGVVDALEGLFEDDEVLVARPQEKKEKKKKKKDKKEKDKDKEKKKKKEKKDKKRKHDDEDED